ncbi:MAG: type I phosphomannose isomerase catalytic subunit [Candidatus Velthaea sp.]
MSAAARLYPYVLVPKETPAIWGGDALVTRYGKSADPTALIGESWECWDGNRVGNGAFAGATLAELRGRLGAELMGPLDPAHPFPVLTKFIDARDALSVQVHPGDEYAQRVEHQANGKTECWYILAAEPGANLILGWSRETGRAEVERRTADGTLGDILRRVAVAPGDAFYLPAGTLHAIGAGIQLFETQQTSDLTYRLFDWNRLGADGKPRELHVAKAADVLDYRATFPGAVRDLSFRDSSGAERAFLIADPRFLVERVRFAGRVELPTAQLPVSMTTLGIPLRVEAGAGATTLRPYETIVVPAALPSVTVAAGGRDTAEVLVVRPAPRLDAARDLALRAGCTAAAADAFFAQFPAWRAGSSG